MVRAGTANDIPNAPVTFTTVKALIRQLSGSFRSAIQPAQGNIRKVMTIGSRGTKLIQLTPSPALIDEVDDQRLRREEKDEYAADEGQRYSQPYYETFNLF